MDDDKKRSSIIRRWEDGGMEIVNDPELEIEYAVDQVDEEWANANGEITLDEPRAKAWALLGTHTMGDNVIEGNRNSMRLSNGLLHTDFDPETKSPLADQYVEFTSDDAVVRASRFAGLTGGELVNPTTVRLHSPTGA